MVRVLVAFPFAFVHYDAELTIPQQSSTQFFSSPGFASLFCLHFQSFCLRWTWSLRRCAYLCSGFPQSAFRQRTRFR